eukprot:752100-Hanusia_phi.AAC.1
MGPVDWSRNHVKVEGTSFQCDGLIRLRGWDLDVEVDLLPVVGSDGDGDKGLIDTTLTTLHVAPSDYARSVERNGWADVQDRTDKDCYQWRCCSPAKINRRRLVLDEEGGPRYYGLLRREVDRFEGLLAPTGSDQGREDEGPHVALSPRQHAT